MTIQTLQGALQQAVRTAFSTANDFNGDLHAMCDWYGVPAAPISGRLIPAAKLFDPSITDAASALNYFLQNPTSVPALALDFTTGTLDPRITFTRGSQATLFDSAGTLVFAPNNLIRNNTMVGAVAGTPGTLPTNWSGAATTNGLSRQIVGTGTSNGITYIDVRYSGTTTAGAFVNFAAPEVNNFIAASNGQSWTSSAWIAVVGGSTANLTNLSMRTRFSDAGSVELTQAAVNLLTATSTMQRFSIAATASNASTAFVSTNFSFQFNNGVAIDITLRIGMPQLERGSVATAVNATSGTAYYGPRFDYDPSTLAARGLLIEEARTNSIRNNTMQGAVAGTPGTLPTNWSGSAATDLTREIVGTGTENGINYIDLKYTGTVSASRTQFIFFEPSNQIAATNGQSWAGSVWVKLVAGSLANITSVGVQADTRDASLVYVSTPFVQTFTPTSTFTRYSGSGSATGATIAWIQPFVRFITASTGAIDITLRIGLPQLELGAFATSVIPTTTTALTRNADVASMTGTNFSSWYNAVEGTLFGQFSVTGYAPASAFPATATISDNSANNRYSLNSANTGANLYPYAEITTGGVAQAGLYGATGAAFGVNTVRKAILAYATNNVAYTAQGLSVQTDTSVTLPTVDRMFIGTNNNGNAQYQNGHIQRISYYPSRLPDGTLQALTA